MLRGYNITTTSTGLIAPGGGGAVLWCVNINTPTAGAVLKLYNNVAVSAPDILASIDCSQQASLWYAVYANKGLFYALSGANADITVGYQ